MQKQQAVCTRPIMLCVCRTSPSVAIRTRKSLSSAACATDAAVYCQLFFTRFPSQASKGASGAITAKERSVLTGAGP